MWMLVRAPWWATCSIFWETFPRRPFTSEWYVRHMYSGIGRCWEIGGLAEPGLSSLLSGPRMKRGKTLTYFSARWSRSSDSILLHKRSCTDGFRLELVCHIEQLSDCWVDKRNEYQSLTNVGVFNNILNANWRRLLAKQRIYPSLCHQFLQSSLVHQFLQSNLVQ